MAEVSVAADIEETARIAPARIRYLGEGDYVTRRYVSQGAEMNTGDYFDYDCVVRDGMPMRDHFALDVHGFTIATHQSAIADFHDRPSVDTLYLEEVEELVTRLCGASRTAAQGWMIRTSSDLSARAKEKVAGYQHTGGIQPPAGEAHVDYNEATGSRAAARIYADRYPDGPGYKRYICFSLWRTFSPGPQDWPLAVCDGRTVTNEETASNTLFVVDEFPVGDALTAPVDGEDQMIAATIFKHRDRHRWWYFSNMTASDVLLFKFQDSDHSVTWRCPHTAFHDTSFADAKARTSIEVRCIAYFE
ncbi:CmcJ/NvfI family oxidoreductase [Novosphingobium sp. MMS21-SN21R]|uniref:CmcJ/NvfI family oxidoreductase n=1 Tax=Novosphingobium sp. MMS21-SN21R TaxID=2969298 RepID=UPI002886D536|nr:CmcJ/NvfI family oxidoreductase [Novosphingobium sp. MMS21-SN21R]MDT0507610.1 CmcJ/NvfI family oxidoreductase [Novosphingobium sp. MMS21-SN21R]